MSKDAAERIAARHDDREAIRQRHADLRAMHSITNEWHKLTDAGKRFMLSALSSGMKETGFPESVFQATPGAANVAMDAEDPRWFSPCPDCGFQPDTPNHIHGCRTCQEPQR